LKWAHSHARGEQLNKFREILFGLVDLRYGATSPAKFKYLDDEHKALAAARELSCRVD
jgi:hypothetical protein